MRAIHSAPDMPPAGTSRDDAEIAHFAKDSARWWDENGPFRPLHRLNPTRIRYIRDRMTAHFERDSDGFSPFTGLSVVDIGCGGGLTSEAMTRLGATVTGVDADRQAIDTAIDHAEGAGLAIDYRNDTAEALLDRHRGSFDVVLALEIIEHVADPASFVKSCADLCRPGGLVIVSTLNRTPRSFALGIVAAEYVLGWVPRGTHRWKKFVRPSALAGFARSAGLNPVDVTGLVFNPLKNDFELSKTDIAVNYFMCMEKAE